MALAPYFSKNALAIQHILKKGNFQEFEAILNKHVVEIAFDKHVLGHEGRCCLDLLIKIIARLYPKLKFTPLGEEVDGILRESAAKAMSINPLIELVDEPATVCLIIGSTEYRNGTPVFYLGSDHWNVLLSDHKPVSSGVSLLPFGAGTAACIGAANLFRIVFAKLLNKTPDKEVCFSLLDPYENSLKPITCDDLGIFHLVGIGAIGNGCLWALSLLPGIKGKLVAIDHQKVTLSNIQRYVQTIEKDKKTQKTIIAARSLKQSLIEVDPIKYTWNEFIGQSVNYRAEVVLTALDTAKDRIAVQASLPKIIFNGYTDDGLLGVARHLNFLDQACITCMYTPQYPLPRKTERIAKDLGVPELNIRDQIALNSKVDEPLLRQIAESNQIAFDEIKRFKGLRINEFYSEFICAGVLLQMRGINQTSVNTVEAPLAFQSALAGILMVADLYLYKAGINLKYNRTHYNTMAPLRQEVNFTHHPFKKFTKDCICCDPIYRNVYKNKWLIE